MNFSAVEYKVIDFIVDRRGLLSIVSILAISLLSYGIKNIYFESDYRVFFKEDNPHMVAHETMQEIYTNSDNMAIYLSPTDNNIFTKDTIELIKKATDEAWQTPYSVRVDTLTNFQNSWAEGDDLIVKDLVWDEDSLDKDFLEKIKTIALNERQLVKRVVSPELHTTLINISLELPPPPDVNADLITQKKQRALRYQATLDAMRHGEKIRNQLHASDPGMEVHLLGLAALNTAFSESSKHDLATLFPLMYLIIIILLALFLRSLSCVLGTVLVIGVATLCSLGLAGWFNYSLNMISVISPMIILTVAVCDCVHLLIIFLRQQISGKDNIAAMKESLYLNFQPIIITSVTTAIGFATLNFSDNPPINMLGTICAFGVMFAMLLTFSLLPGITLLLVRKPKFQKKYNLFADQIAELVIDHPRKCFSISLAVSLLLISQVGRNIINNDPLEYLQEGTPLNAAAAFTDQYMQGARFFSYSIDCGSPGCANDPEELKRLESFVSWYEKKPGVAYVTSYIDVIKRLNKNMHGDDPAFYRTPETRDLSAQYQLIYELSLPYGLDLNNLINLEKSATKVTVYIKQITSGEIIALDESAQQWFDLNAPDLKTHGSSVSMMFTHVGEDNIRSMMTGSLIALIGITITILIALRSFKYGFISLLPNAFPVAVALGIWGIFVGTVNMAVAMVFSVTLGIVVDNTVHFVSKYLRSRRLYGNSVEEAIRYAFSMVGSALIVTTVTLAVGFGLLMLSYFNINAYLGALVSITIVVALIFDFLFLPSLLILMKVRNQV